MPAAEETGPGTLTDPYRAYNFKLEIQGVAEGHFTECTGPEIEVEVIAYREAGSGQVIRHVPGQARNKELTLSYGLTDSTDLWQWFQATVRGQVERRNVSIVMLGIDGVEEAMRWNLVGAWPSRWKGVTMNTLSREMGIESLTLVFDSLERD